MLTGTGEQLCRAATMDDFAEYSREIKRGSPAPIHNIFINSGELAKVMDSKDCLLEKTGDSLFLLVPRHKSFYELLFISATAEKLARDLPSFISQSGIAQPLRASLPGKEPHVGQLAEIFEKSGFILGRKLARMREVNNFKKTEALLAAMCDDGKCEVDFARPGEEAALLELLLTEFDLRGDNLPELSEIRENIKRKQAIVIRKDGLPVAMHYFTIQNSCSYSWYDVIKKEFRKDGLFLYVMLYKYRYLISRPELARFYSWRNANNRRLMSFAKMNEQKPDGVYIYNMLYDGQDK